MTFEQIHHTTWTTKASAGKILNDKHDRMMRSIILLLSMRPKNMAQKSKEGAPIYVCHADSEGLNFRAAFNEAGWDL